MLIVKEKTSGVEVLPDGDVIAGGGVGAQTVPEPLVALVVAHGGREERGDGLDVCLDTRCLLNEVV